ncbi:MarR family transcriptional regulator [Asanoa sp. WMMD1127]|uniref:MarR family winged helix-turn-helix transcriptional regulator n=1 Tax=Asanoa sp. WMMD1127 TaxID=3016107 RepID=UPI0024177BA0|nr:MarR family transcriptional regulator [Asanoa sp. WMMD1127]MDG4821485.1 MarR family transcriptional regulator [Asanoa sp. WMMD1127]
MTDPLDHQANLLGAFALAMADRTAAAVTAAGEGGAAGNPTAAAALSALLHFLDRPSIDQLRRVLGLTPSGAVRLVDRLAEAGLVTRGPGGDGRSRSVALTPAGRAAATRLSAARAATLRSALGALSATERSTLDNLIGRMMAGVVEEKEGGAWLCRLCDLTACGRDTGQCQTANAAAAKYGAAATRRDQPDPRA